MPPPTRLASPPVEGETPETERPTRNQLRLQWAMLLRRRTPNKIPQDPCTEAAGLEDRTEEPGLSEGEPPSESSDAESPRDLWVQLAVALAMVRELAEELGASSETWELMESLEAHLGVTPGVPPHAAAAPWERTATSSTTPP